jgi:hypothetical protein
MNSRSKLFAMTRPSMAPEKNERYAKKRVKFLSFAM